MEESGVKLGRKPTKISKKSGLAQSIARSITYFRNQAEMSQVELAEKLKVSNKTVSRWERAEFRITAEQLWLVATVLDVPVRSFFPEPEGDK